MDRKTLLEQGLTEEQVTKILNDFHNENSAIIAERDKLAQDLTAKTKEATELAGYKAKVEEIEKANLSKEEQIALKEKEIEQKLAEANKITNTAKAKAILSAVGIDDEDIIATVVRTDEAKTIENANKIATRFKAMQEETVKKTTESLQNMDIKPGASNIPPTGGAMTWEKFEGLSQEEQNKFAEEHPEEFANL